MKFINFTVVKFSFFLVMGILFAHFYPLSTFLFSYILVLLLGVFVLWLWARKQLFQKVYFGMAAYLCFFAIGCFSYQTRMPQHQPRHFTHLVADEKPVIIELKILEELKPGLFNNKYIAAVKEVNNRQTGGKVLLNVKKDSTKKSFFPDEVLLVYAPITEIKAPLNPHQFDYSEYMKSLGVYGQIRIEGGQVLDTQKGKPTLFGTSQKIRGYIVEKLQKTSLEVDERAIIQALILGEKKEINKNLYSEYAAAGAVHILAVSGLHVGIVYFILLFLLKPFRNLKHSKIFKASIIVLFLWGFAVLSGLSPSVTRAVTMFSFFALATVLNRQTNTLNTLFLSFLLLLIINPLWLFQIGFQLSYLAVFFIVWLQPIFFKVGYSKYWIIRKIWVIVTVSISAQIGVLPLSLYYFHQFPGLFLFTNIVILPFLSILMCGGIIIIILASFESLPNWLTQIYNIVIEGLNNFIHWIAMQEDFLFINIHFSALKVIGCYFLIITLALLLKNVTYRKLITSLLGIALFLSIYIYDKIKTSENEFIIFQKSKETLIGHKNGKNLTLFIKDTTKNNKEIYPIKSYITAKNIQVFTEEKLPKLFSYNQKNVLVIDRLGLFPKQGKIHTVLLTGSPKINLNRLIDSLNPQQIVADGSNYYSYVKRWEKTCEKKKLPFCHTAKQGAFSLE